MKTYKLKGIHCQSCSKELEERINQTQKESLATIDFANRVLNVSDGTDTEKLKRVLAFEKITFSPMAEKSEESSRIHQIEAHHTHEGHGHSHAHAHDVDFSSGDVATRNIKIVFFLNAFFAIIEFIFGGLFNSTAILTDAVHDTGDAISVGLAWFFQKVSTKEANEKYTFGHQRFSLLGALITAVVLLGGSIVLLFHVIPELFNPEPVHYQGMFWLAIFAICSKLFCMWLMSKGSSHNETLLNVHMLEDLLGWVGVLIVSVTVRFTQWYILDPILSLLIALFIIYKTWPMFVETVEIFLDATPKEMNVEALEKSILDIREVNALSHLHIWSIDGQENVLTVTVSMKEKDPQIQEKVKEKIRLLMRPYNTTHSTIEIIVDEEGLLTKN
jgi:cobalt-zinc-cadmium efflux system protein